MKSNTIISEMFEEIKSRLVAIEKKLGSQAPRQKESDEAQKTNSNKGTIEEILHYIAKYLSAIYSETSDIPGKVQDLENKMLSKMEEVRITMDEQKKERVIHHRHVVDLKSSKVVLAFVVLGFVLFGAIGANVYQYRMIGKMKDNDLMYRYIKDHNGINSRNLSKLEDIFHYRRDDKLIKKIREEVEEFEMKVRKRAAETEKKRLEEDN